MTLVARRAPVSAIDPIERIRPITEREFSLFQALILRESGIFLVPAKKALLVGRLSKRLRALGLSSFGSYYERIVDEDDREERLAMLDCVSTNETHFFREPRQFEFLERQVVPHWRQHGPRVLRIWSAGCSTGQEPYTLAMLVADGLAYYYLRNPLPYDMPLPKPLVPPPWRVEITASDIAYSVLRAAQEGFYSEAQMASVDYSYRLRFFDKVGDRYAVKKALKELVHFDFHNLKTEYLPQRNDVIFCRNVMMYFDEPEQRRLIEKFYRCLNPQGYLFVGHAESLLGLTEKFQMVHRNSGTAYQRIEVNL